MNTNDITIIPLGTVSPYPKDNRNCPAFLIRYKDKKILLDCGSGSTRLLNIPEDLNNLHVFLTHYHFDHISDINTLQYASLTHHNIGTLDKRIKIYLPDNDINGVRNTIVSNKDSYSEYLSINNKAKYQLDNLTISFEDNNSHSIESYMIKLKNQDTKIVYTSDIGPTNFDKLIDFCKDSDILICESSFLRKYDILGTNKNHFTALDAATLAKKSNSKQLILTHFWPEEDRKLYLEEAMKVFENTQTAEEGKKLVLGRNSYGRKTC